MQDFRNLKIWQKAHELALLVYKLTQDFPREELFGLRNSLRKTCVDIPAYIAEGSGKSSDPDFARCVGLALSMTTRLEYYTLIAFDLKFINEIDNQILDAEIIELKKMLSGFYRKLN